MIRGAGAAIVVVTLLAGAAAAGEVFDRETLDFARQVDTGALGLIGVQYRGRIAILETVATEQVRQMYGSARIDSQEPVFAYLEIYFHAGRYVDRPLIYVREKNMRAFVGGKLDAGTAAAFARTHRLPPAALLDMEGWRHLLYTGRASRTDFHRARSVSSLRELLPELSERKEFRLATDRLSARHSSFVGAWALRVAPRRKPAPGAPGEWLSADEVFLGSAAVTRPAESELAGKWLALRDAWRRRDAAAVNGLIREVGKLLSVEAGRECPSLLLRRLERLYNYTGKSTVVWVGYAVALVLLIVAAASGYRWARWTGLGVFAVSTAMLLAGFVVRWLLSGREWYLPPIMNQFEAVLGSALLGAAIAIVLELLWQKSYFALAAALYATIALLCGFFLPERMGAGIGAQPGILASPVMAIHVSVIIVGHALVGMTLFISLAYLGVGLFRGLRRGQGAASSPADLRPAGEIGVLAVIDRCNLIVAQLACWTVIVGTVLGAYWGDFAWGRWWGWDPKETWALITALIYVAVLHVRFITPPRWRGLLTACGCVLGCAVMLFNWIFVNYFIAGKHSYA